MLTPLRVMRSKMVRWYWSKRSQIETWTRSWLARRLSNALLVDRRSDRWVAAVPTAHDPADVVEVTAFADATGAFIQIEVEDGLATLTRSRALDLATEIGRAVRNLDRIEGV